MRNQEKPPHAAPRSTNSVATSTCPRAHAIPNGDQSPSAGPGAPAPGEAAMQPCSELLRAELRPEAVAVGSLRVLRSSSFESSEGYSSAMRAVACGASLSSANKLGAKALRQQRSGPGRTDGRAVGHESQCACEAAPRIPVRAGEAAPRSGPGLAQAAQANPRTAPGTTNQCTPHPTPPRPGRRRPRPL